jgi:hypothetical protein
MFGLSFVFLSTFGKAFAGEQCNLRQKVPGRPVRKYTEWKKRILPSASASDLFGGGGF